MNRTHSSASLGIPAILVTVAVLLSGGCATAPAELESRDHFSVDVSIDDGQTVHAIGDTLQLSVRVSHDAQVVVFNTNAHDQTTVLFPNASAPENRLIGGQTTQLPGPDATYLLRVGPPEGQNRIRVIATTSEHPMLNPAALTLSSGPFPAYSESTDSVTRRIQIVATEHHDVHWAMQDLVFRVVP